jgi:hypothetical protein
VPFGIEGLSVEMAIRYALDLVESIQIVNEKWAVRNPKYPIPE